MANKQLRETLSLDRGAFRERVMNELKDVDTCDKARAITECLDHFIKDRAWVDRINLDDITVMVTQSNGDDKVLAESVANRVSPKAMTKKLDEGSNSSDWDLMRKAKNCTQEEVLKALKGVVSTKRYNDIKDDYKIAKLRVLTKSEQEKVCKKLEDCKKAVQESLKTPVKESKLLEGTSNFGSLTNFPLLVYISLDDFEDSLDYVDECPKMEDFDNEDDYYEARDKFFDDYYDKYYKAVALLTDEDVANLESDIDTFNAETKDICSSMEEDKYYDNSDLEDVRIKLEPGYYEGVQVDVEHEEYLDSLDDDVKQEQLTRFNKFFDEIKDKYGLTSLEVSYRASNGETGYKIKEAMTENYLWHSIDLEKNKAEELKQFLRDNEIYFEPSSNGDYIHFEIKVDTDDVKNMIDKFLNEGLKEPKEEIKDGWVQFTYEDGGNPYVAKTEMEKNRLLRKYKGRVEKLSDTTYLVKKEAKEPVKEGYYDYLDKDYADILDSDINVYDVKQYVLDDTDNKFRTHYTDKYAIYVCANGKGCVVDYEAVGQDFDDVNGKISFGVEENKDNEYIDEQGNKHRTINVMATHRLNTTPKEIIEKAPKEIMKFRDFFRKYKYNDRCASNFKSLAEYIKKNDDLSKYHKILDDNDEKNA